MEININLNEFRIELYNIPQGRCYAYSEHLNEAMVGFLFLDDDTKLLVCSDNYKSLYGVTHIVKLEE